MQHSNIRIQLIIASHSHTLSFEFFVGDIRLVNGSVPSQGRVELFYEGEWGRVDVSSTISDITVARVACQQVGYPYCGGTGDFGRSSGPAWVFILSCTGDEERLEQCSHFGWRYSLCFNCPGLGVRCIGECTVCEVYTCWIDISLL